MRKIFLFLLLLIITFSVPFFHVSADPIDNGNPLDNGGSLTLQNPLGPKNNTIADILKTILDWITIEIGPPLAVLMIVIGGFQMVFASGDPERFRRGRQTIVYTVIGYGIIFLAWGLVSLIQNILKS